MGVLVDINMTQEEVMAVLEPPKASEKTKFVFEGLMLNSEQPENKRFLFPTKKGGTQVKAKLRVIDPDPAENGKGLIYNGVIGQFSFANLCKVVKIMSGTGVDDEAAIGTEFYAKVTHGEYDRDDGTKGTSVNLSNMRLEV